MFVALGQAAAVSVNTAPNLSGSYFRKWWKILPDLGLGQQIYGTTHGFSNFDERGKCIFCLVDLELNLKLLQGPSGKTSLDNFMIISIIYHVYHNC